MAIRILRSRGLAADEIRSHLDSHTANVDRRFRAAFAIGAFALVVIIACFGSIVLRQQLQMRDVAFGMYDHAFAPDDDINRANVEFQRFVDKRAIAKGTTQVEVANQLLDPVVAALDAAAERADDDDFVKAIGGARASVLDFEGRYEDGGPTIRSLLRETQADLTDLAAKAVDKGRSARDRIAATAAHTQILMIGAILGAVVLGLMTLMVLRRSVAVSAISQISRMANYDSLTGLPNRNLLQRRLVACLTEPRRAGLQIALLALDLDRFKNVNDTLGHHTGDLLLVEVAERARKVLGPQDTVARFGGDEFVVLLHDIRGPAEAAAAAERLVASLGAPYEFEGQRVLVGVSVGIALAPQHGKSAEDLLRNADLALYLAKAEGKGRHRFFDAALNASIQDRRRMELDLREALEADRLDVYYQPMIDVHSGQFIACEALARWDRPGHGFVPPSEFIPLAEELGLILALGESVLRKACKAAAQWPANIRIAVNLSARQCQDDDLVATITRSLADSGLAASRLELEITESTLLGDKARVLAVLTALRALGVHIALDDFGTGYSSLSYLSSFPFDKIKIDRSFVTNVDARPDAAAIVRAVINLATTLGMTTTAEGVETTRDLDWLKKHGCDSAQGYLVSAPLPLGEIDALLRGTPPRLSARDLAA